MGEKEEIRRIATSVTDEIRDALKDFVREVGVLAKLVQAAHEAAEKFGGLTPEEVLFFWLYEALEKGLLREGQHVLMASFGSGFTWASTVVRW